MNLTIQLREIVKSITIKQESIFIKDLHAMKNFLDTLKEPEDDFERSYNQYKCQKFMLPFYIGCLQNITSFFLLGFYAAYFCFHRKIAIKDTSGNDAAIFFSEGMETNIIPRELCEKYSKIAICKYGIDMTLCKKDWQFIFSLYKRYPVSFYFLLKNIMKISMYSTQIRMYEPKAVIICSEYSFTSSVLTSYCEMYGIEHINVMHGEKLFYIINSFFRFHRFYVWDKHYINLFNKLRAETSQFVVAIPGSLTMDIDKNDGFPGIKYDLKYFLGYETESNLKAIAEVFDALSKAGYTLAVRPHPRYSDINKIKSIFKDYDIENLEKTSLKESLCNTKYIVSLYTTVLCQGFGIGKGIIVDDVTNPDKYNKLKQLDYIILSKPHLLLSDILKGMQL
ncbi:MAG: hypothetical protein M1308_18440 [Actinobacteria bacterium]|nr:hypothetical protein [Actinomycetota bacterium]